jgi:catalase
MSEESKSADKAEKEQRQGTGTGWVDRPDPPDVRAALAERVGRQQEMLMKGAPSLHGVIGRGQHQKQLLGAFGVLTVLEAPRPEVRLGFFGTPGKYKAACRFSNGQPCPFRDQAPDVRGVAIKLFTREGVETDLTMTNEGGRSHARDAAQFTEIADILAAQDVKGGTLQALELLARDLLTGKLGPIEAARVATILAEETVFRKVHSMTTEHYWGSVVEADGRAFKVSVHPHPSTVSGTEGDPKSPDYLRDDLRNRLGKGPIRFQLGVQLFVDEEKTPVNDASVAWKAPIETVAELAIAEAPTEADEKLIDRMAFNPARGFAPLGVTHARGDVYAASARNRDAIATEEIRKYFD